jgi:hypothetical protein
MAYVIWREEHLWNMSVLQRVHLSKLVTVRPSISINTNKRTCDGRLPVHM